MDNSNGALEGAPPTYSEVCGGPVPNEAPLPERERERVGQKADADGLTKFGRVFLIQSDYHKQ